jgi:hypothetical protein
MKKKKLATFNTRSNLDNHGKSFKFSGFQSEAYIFIVYVLGRFILIPMAACSHSARAYATA